MLLQPERLVPDGARRVEHRLSVFEPPVAERDQHPALGLDLAIMVGDPFIGVLNHDVHPGAVRRFTGLDAMRPRLMGAGEFGNGDRDHLAPSARSSGFAFSASLWLIPFSQGTNTMAEGQSRAMLRASWPAPE